MAAGHAGHILVSAVTADLLSSRIGPDIELVDRGSHSLSGLHDHIQIFEVAHEHSPDGALSLRTEDALRSNLPEPLSSFVGRIRELQEVTTRLDASRLVTLTGAGGTGKTRLAVESARTMALARVLLSLRRCPRPIYQDVLSRSPSSGRCIRGLREERFRRRPMPASRDRPRT